jgi:hypothetical protein
MSKLKSFACAGAVALGLSLLASVASTAAPPPHNNGNGDNNAASAAVAGGVLGFIAGAASANSASDDGPDYGPPPPHFHGGYGEHVRLCFQHYGHRYDPHSDLVHFHGRVFRCDDWPGRGPGPGYGPPSPDRGYDAPPPDDDN